MTKRILALIVMAGMVFIIHSTFAQKGATTSRIDKKTISNPRSTPVLKPMQKELTVYDPLRYEYITGSMAMEGGSSLRISVINCRDEGDEYVQIEVHAVEVAGPRRTPKLINKTELIKLPPHNIYCFKHVRRGDGTDGNQHEHWVKIKASSEYIIPKVVRCYKHDPYNGPLLISVSYLPGDFAVYTRHPFKRIR